jgi:hypothetical protein
MLRCVLLSLTEVARLRSVRVDIEMKHRTPQNFAKAMCVRFACIAVSRSGLLTRVCMQLVGDRHLLAVLPHHRRGWLPHVWFGRQGQRAR